MADDAVVLLGVPRQETRYVFECNQRNVEAVAEADEAACFIAGVDVEHSGQISRLVSYDAYRASAHACKTDNNVLGKVLLTSKK